MNIQEYEEKIKQLNERYISSSANREEIQREISRLLNEDNLAYKLQNRLLSQVNQQISPKARERLSTRQFFLKCEGIEEDVIQSGFPYAFFYGECTVEEIRDIRLDVLDKKTLMWLVIEALKGFVDNELADDPKALTLHALYLKLKKALMPEIPFEEGDGFVDYIASKTERMELETARSTGLVCIHCGSTDVVSYDSQKWLCKNCGRFFRKHRAKKEE